eukprot:203993-Amphidinium_carterae.1
MRLSTAGNILQGRKGKSKDLTFGRIPGFVLTRQVQGRLLATVPAKELPLIVIDSKVMRPAIARMPPSESAPAKRLV